MSKAETCGFGYDPDPGNGCQIFWVKFLDSFLGSCRELRYSYFQLTIPGWTRLSLTWSQLFICRYSAGMLKSASCWLITTTFSANGPLRKLLESFKMEKMVWLWHLLYEQKLSQTATISALCQVKIAMSLGVNKCFSLTIKFPAKLFVFLLNYSVLIGDLN